MESILGIPANNLLIALLFLLGLIVVIVAYTAIRYPVPFRLGIRKTGYTGQPCPAGDSFDTGASALPGLRQGFPGRTFFRAMSPMQQLSIRDYKGKGVKSELVIGGLRS